MPACELDTKSLTRVNPRVVDATFNSATQGQLDQEALARGLKELLATDDFQQVRYRVDSTDTGRYLAIEPREKAWGPNYLHLGLNLSTDFQGASAFNLNVDHRMTWLTDRGLEWRNRFYLGDLTGIASELYQPLDLARKWFSAGRLVAAQELENIFLDEDAVAQYRNRRGEVALELGRRIGTYGDARVGYRYGQVSFTKSTGSPALPDSHDDLGAAYLQLTLDQYNNWNFPSSGYIASLNLSTTRQSLGSDVDYYSGTARLRKGIRHGRQPLPRRFRLLHDLQRRAPDLQRLRARWLSKLVWLQPARISRRWRAARTHGLRASPVLAAGLRQRAFTGEALSRQPASTIASMVPIRVA